MRCYDQDNKNFTKNYEMARVTGLEPATSGVTGQHSNQLSYTRALLLNQFNIGTSGRVRVSFVYVKQAYAFFKKNYQTSSLALRLEKFFLKGVSFNYCSLYRAISSAGRAPRLHRGCREFESLIAHHYFYTPCNLSVSRIF